MKATVTVVIVNWNGGWILDQCIEHLLHQTFKPTCILLMDNDSTDGSAERVRARSGITVKKLRSNIGFAAANNRAIEMCKTEFIALLNPDAFPNAEWLENLVAAAESHPDMAAFGSCQINNAKPEMLDGIGDVYHISGLVWRHGYGCVQCPAVEVAREIFSPCACAALYRRKALTEVGGMDEDYFCYVEDVDLGFKLRLSGYKSMYVPDAIVKHVGSAATGGRHSDFAIYHGHRNMVWTFVKNMPGVLFWLLLPLHVFLNLFAVIYFAFQGHTKTILQAKVDAVMGIAHFWKKRQIIQSTRIASVFDIWRVLDKRIGLNRNLY